MPGKNYKSVIYFLLLIFLVCGCASKKIDINYVYNGTIPQIDTNNSTIMLRSIGEKFYDKDSEQIGTVVKNALGVKIINFGWGIIFKRQLADSIKKIGFHCLVTSSPVLNLEEYNLKPLLKEARHQNARYLIVAWCGNMKITFDNKIGRNMAKALIPIYGAFAKRDKAFEMKFVDRFIVFDVFRDSIIFDKQYPLSGKKEFSYPKGEGPFVTLQKSITCFQELNNKAISMFWSELASSDDF